jgi:hypothetical protein
MAIEIDLERDQLQTLAEAARTLPGGPVHVGTLHRWRLRGVRGVKLPTVLVGGIRRTSREAVAKWIAATTAAADGTNAPERTSKQRERAILAAERELSA